MFGPRSGPWVSSTDPAPTAAAHSVGGPATSGTPARPSRNWASGPHHQLHPPPGLCGRRFVASTSHKVSAATKWGGCHKPGLLPRVAVRSGRIWGRNGCVNWRGRRTGMLPLGAHGAKCSLAFADSPSWVLQPSGGKAEALRERGPRWSCWGQDGEKAPRVPPGWWVPSIAPVCPVFPPESRVGRRTGGS